jgi:hypothetical protein
MTLNAPAATAIKPTNTTAPIATLAPSATAAPTNTAVPTTVPATATKVPPTALPTSAFTATLSTYNCMVLSISPAPGEFLLPGQDFDANWSVKNTGSVTWSIASVDARFTRGAHLQKLAEVYKLTAEVAKNGTYKVGVDMKAPYTAGTYTTTWHLVAGDTKICALDLTIVVK